MNKINHLKEIVGPALAVDAVVFTRAPVRLGRTVRGSAIKDNELSVLLIKAKDPDAGGNWVLPGGFVRLEETLDAAVARVLKEKAGININYLEQLYTFSALDRDTRGRVVTTAYFALVDFKKFKLETTPRYSHIEWFPVSSLPTIGYDHGQIIRKAITRIRNKLAYSNVACHLLPEAFTLTQLQGVYETTLGRKLDKRNFRRKILGLGVIREIGERERFAAHRPAKLYKFVSKRYEEVELI